MSNDVSNRADARDAVVHPKMGIVVRAFTDNFFDDTGDCYEEDVGWNVLWMDGNISWAYKDDAEVLSECW